MGGFDEHLEKMLQSVYGPTVEAIVTSWPGRSEKWTPYPVSGLEEIFHYISEGTFVSWMTANI